MKFSSLIINLTDTWILWMEHNNLSKDENLSYKKRRLSVEKCEDLIKKRYKMIEKLDNKFSEYE